MANINPAMLNAELFPKMKEAEASVVNQWRIQEEKLQREQIGEDANMLMQQAPNQYNWDTSGELMRAGGL